MAVDRHFIYNIFADIPMLDTEHLLLRRMKVGDAADMFDYAKRDDVTRYLTWHSHKTEEYTKQYLQYVQKQYADGDLYDWALIDRESGRMIGTCGFTGFDFDNECGEVGYVIHPDFRGRGLAPEAVRRVMQFGFERLHLHRIKCMYMEGNEASRRVMEKCGMHYEGTFRQAMRIKDRFCTVVEYAILREEFDA